MARIATFVFVDLETTSIPSQEFNKTRIVELSMVALKRRHLLDTKNGTLPRVLHKLTMCFNPGRIIDPGASAQTGLDNFIVEYETPFNIKVFNTIDSFLGCLEKPVCLIAQNGHGFDFPILKNHFEKLKVHLAEDILCADSLHAFYDILNNVADVEPVLQNNNKSLNTVPQDEVDETCAQNDKLNNNNESVNLTNLKDQDELLDNNGIIDTTESTSPLSMQKLNENTPKSNKFIIKPAKKISEARRKLFYQGNEKPKDKFKLKDIYERVLGCPGLDAHRAENDCIMAAEISSAKATQFVEWVDKNHSAFSEVKPMTPGIPLGY